MPPKAKIPAPIDRPLSKAYLREFSGWSTAYPPGLSEPTSLRLMENVVINRDGAAQIRPGLRYLVHQTPGVPLTEQVVGTHEAFYMDGGVKAYLFAVRALAGDVEFRVFANDTVTTLEDAGFIVVNRVAFTAATTYVKYLQIDNKIIALSDNGEPMLEFFVGQEKRAKQLFGIARPEWSVEDKVTVVHPTQAWINTPAAVRRNLDWRAGIETWSIAFLEGFLVTSGGQVAQSQAQTRSGNHSLEISSKPLRTNFMPYTLAAGTSAGWGAGANCTGFGVFPGGYVGGTMAGGSIGYLNGPMMNVPANAQLIFFADVSAAADNSEEWGVMFRWFNSAGAQIGGDVYRPMGYGSAIFRANASVTTPAGTVRGRAYPFVRQLEPGQPLNAILRIRNVTFEYHATATGDYFDGDSGTNYFWTGAADASASVYHPPQDVTVTFPFVGGVTAGEDYWSAIYVRATGTAQPVRMDTWQWVGSGTSLIGSTTVSDTTGGWTRISHNVTPGAGTVSIYRQVTIEDVPFGTKHYIDDTLFELSSAGAAPAFFDGYSTNSDTVQHTWGGAAGASVSIETSYAGGASVPPAATPTTDTLISSDGTENTYNFGFFYGFYNEVGESAMSQVKVMRTQRAWAQWRWETANAAAAPSGTPTAYPGLCADQLVATVPEGVFTDALASGAIGWNLYMFTWSDQSPVPTTAVRVAQVPLTPTSTYDAAGWARVTPPQAQQAEVMVALPTEQTRYNYSQPSRGGQGLVAADRLVLVKDVSDPAVVKWSSNAQGNYTDFSANVGGGYKTLTYGNLYIPACVKLWQNPQSVDTLTILCLGTDGHSTSYYMAPAEVTSQAENTAIMGFEETTATPGTTSPYGVEVFNNALYHPLDDQLMKSTANNYNISHKSQTEMIRNAWSLLQNKELIVSSQHDGRLYFLVNNPNGAELEPGCRGNEVWVFDAQAENGTWSRWLTQGHSLRKVQQGPTTYMSLARPDGFYAYDWDYIYDDVVVGGGIVQRAIPWLLETNTQGANRAHDAWAHLQQANLTVGNFTGALRYGLRGRDLNGKVVEVSKILRSPDPVTPDQGGGMAWDQEDFLLVRRAMKEWFFFASSIVEDDEVVASGGQLSLVQYRYTPVSVNVGYEYGSVETFEYGAAGLPATDRTSENGVPWPYADSSRP